MRLFLFFTVLIISLNSFGQKQTIAKILSTNYEFKMISSGDNRPNFKVYKDSLREILILLHHGISQEEIKTYFKFTDSQLSQKLELLIDANFIKRTDKGYLPSVFICSFKEGQIMQDECMKMIQETANSIERNLPIIKSEIQAISSLKEFSFEQLSLLILSDVLLDNWQIENVENDFLNKERTKRHGKNYYASFQAKTKNDSVEAFGVFGNQIEDTLNFSICRYGNIRYAKQIVAKNEELKMQFIKNRKAFNYPIIDTLTYKALQKIANFYKQDLIKILDKNKRTLYENYKNSKYFKEISFEEYFIWLYHIYYTGVTDELIKRNVITLPEEKVSFYVLTNE
jgi:hypothetical protein